jgi:DNA-binding CsgD family transcriptional regulator
LPEEKILSEREEEVLRLVATGMTNREIAQSLTISPNTVKVHLSNIFEKLGVASRTEATLYGIEHGIVAVPGNEAATPESPLVEELGFIRKYMWAWVPLALILLAVLISIGMRYVFPPPTPTPVAQQLEDRWQELAPMPEPRAGLAAAAYDGDIYAIAGEGRDGVSRSVFRYLPEEDRWESLKDKPTPVRDVEAALLGEKIYVPGGKLADGSVTDILEIYNPRADTWQAGARLPQALSAYALADFEGRLYLFGGWDGEQALDSVYIYDPDADAWDEGTAMPTARWGAGAGVIQDRIFVIGGWNLAGLLRDNEVYLPSREGSGVDIWEIKEPLIEEVVGLGIENLGDLLFAVTKNGDNKIQVLQFNNQENRWLLSSDVLSIPLFQELRTTTLTDHIYVLGNCLSGDEIIGLANKYKAIYINLLPNIEF